VYKEKTIHQTLFIAEFDTAATVQLTQGMEDAEGVRGIRVRGWGLFHGEKGVRIRGVFQT